LVVALTPGMPIHCSVAAWPENTAKTEIASSVPILALTGNTTIGNFIFIINLVCGLGLKGDQ
jgi:hypothetical protein